MKYSIAEIEKLFPNWYDPGHTLSYDEQKWIWENTPLPEEDTNKLRNKQNSTSGNVYAYEDVGVNGTCKFRVIPWLNQTKNNLVLILKHSKSKNVTYIEIASYLDGIFEDWPPNFKNYWLFIAQTYTLRVINWVLADTIKAWKRGAIRKTPAHYFSDRIGFRKKRKFRTSKKSTDFKTWRNGNKEQLRLIYKK